MEDCPSCDDSFSSVAAMKSHHMQVHGESLRISQKWRVSSEYREVRLRVLERDDYSCVECGGDGSVEVHHINPVCRGGAKFDAGNLKTLCEGCHVDAHRRINE